MILPDGNIKELQRKIELHNTGKTFPHVLPGDSREICLDIKKVFNLRGGG